MAAEPCFSGNELPTRSEVIEAFIEHCGEFATISTTGYTSRELARHGPRANHFYMQGSMGFASAIALGVAHGLPQTTVFILDGDGALIMRLGSLATIGALQPPNLVHLVLDNGTYASTGGQPTAAPNVDFPAIARACGYRRVAKCLGREGLRDALQWARSSSGKETTLVHIRISADEGAAQDRPEQSPEQIATAFRHWWSGLHPAAPGSAGLEEEKAIHVRQ
jgi:phosphonopyruvate decarboxylase